MLSRWQVEKRCGGRLLFDQLRTSTGQRAGLFGVRSLDGGRLIDWLQIHTAGSVVGATIGHLLIDRLIDLLSVFGLVRLAVAGQIARTAIAGRIVRQAAIAQTQATVGRE